MTTYFVIDPYPGQRVQSAWDHQHGTVTKVEGDLYYVLWDDGDERDYNKGSRHVYIEA